LISALPGVGRKFLKIAKPGFVGIIGESRDAHGPLCMAVKRVVDEN
jgi:hypothetical protein